MTQSLRKLFCLGIVFIVAAAFVFPVMGQTINVTFRANLATNLDTINAANGFLEMRGAYNGDAPGTLPDGNVIDWSSASTLEMTNDGGDYWSFTCQLNAGDTLVYKFWTGYDESTGTEPGGGWEGPFENIIGIDTRYFIAGASDTVLDMQYYHTDDGSGGIVNQYWRPWEEKADSIAIYFRVNMAGYVQQSLFDPATADSIGVRGGPPVGDVGWSTSAMVLMTREDGSALDSSFYSGVAYVDRDSVTARAVQAYKFVFRKADGSFEWEGDPPGGPGNREFTLSAAQSDTTISWVWFSNTAYDPSLVPPVTALLTFRVSTEALEGLDLFDRGIGDQIFIIGPSGWDLPNPPYPPTGTGNLIEMNFIPALQEWTAVEQFSRIPGTDINYKYFVRWDSSRADSMSPNYIPNLDIRFLNNDNEDSGWEEPSVTGGGNRVYTWTSDPQQNPDGDFGFARQFFNAAPGNCWFDTAMAITWSVNMQPATDAAHNTNPHLFDPATDSVWVQFDGSLFALSQGWPTFNYHAIVLEDPDQDMVYTGTYTVDPPGWYQLGFIITYGTRTAGYVGNGGGTTTGRRYYQFVHPTQILPNPGGQFPTTVWPNSYNLSTIDWVQSNLPFETPPDLTTPTGIEDEIQVANRFALEQNYPNPFNPSTTIKYELARTADVNITIYNIQGQKIKTIVDAKQNVGKHDVVWDGRNEAYNRVASGVYFVKMKAGDFNKTQKMILLK